MYFKAYLQTQCLLLDIRGKSKEIRPQKKLQTSTSLVHPWEQFPNTRRYHIHLYRQQYASKNIMGPRSHPTAQFCLLEMNILWLRKVQINPRTTAKDPVKMLEETGTKVSISTVKRVLYRHNLKGCSARKKPLLQNRHKKARLRFATAHGDKDHTFWRNVLWSDETKI